MMLKAKLTTISGLWLLFLLPFASATTVNYGDHSIEFLGVTGPDNDGLCTWTYEVCSGESPSMSHWIIESCVGTTNEEIEWGIDPPMSGGVKIEYGYDPTTGITGLKFDDLPSDFGCADFWFKVKECTVTDQELGVKAGGDVYTGEYIEGPAHEPNAPEFPSVLIPTTIALAAIGTMFAVRKK